VTAPWGSVAEIVTALATAGLVVVAFFQFRRFNNQVRADFTYKVYRDLCEWLRLHPEAREWINDPEGKALDAEFDAWEIDDYLTYFETVWSLWRTDLVDRDMVYDLLSDYLIVSYEANDRGVEKIIHKMREEGRDASDVYIGVEKLYREMKRMTQAASEATALSWG